MLFLGSSSTFRKKLLDDAGFSCAVVHPEIDEKIISGLHPLELARERSFVKGKDVCRIILASKELSPPSEAQVVIGCDQVLGLGDQAFDKAQSAQEAFERLSSFAGKTHYLYSAYSLFVRRRGESSFQCVVQRVYPAGMTMKDLTSDEIHSYVKTDEWQGVVGCYRYEGDGKKLFVSSDADLSAIIGLPMQCLTHDLDFIKSRTSA